MSTFFLDFLCLSAFICFCLSSFVFFCRVLSSSCFLLASISFLLFSLFSLTISLSFLLLAYFIFTISIVLSFLHFLCFSVSSFIFFIIDTFWNFILPISSSSDLIFCFWLLNYFCIFVCSWSFCLRSFNLSSRSFIFFLYPSSTLFFCYTLEAFCIFSFFSLSKFLIS